MTRGALLIALATATACGGRARPASSIPVSNQCKSGQAWNGRQCAALSRDLSRLRRGESALAELRTEDAVKSLESARQTGPYKHADLVRIHEQLSVAYSYLEDEKKALAAFDMVLALAPGHAISYTLSPKATFLFEKARTAARDRARPELRLSWPRDLSVRDPVPLELEVVADPKSFLRRARLYTRKRGDKTFAIRDLPLPASGEYSRITLPAVGPDATAASALDLYLTAHDDAGNEVLLWGSPSLPREIPLGFEARVPWYRKWWVWGIAGGVVAATTGVVVYAATREPGDLLNGSVSLR